MRLTKTVLAVAASTMFIAAACGSSNNNEPAAGTTTTPGTEATTTAVATTAEATTVAETTTAPAAGGETTTTFVPPARGDADLVIWADDTRAPVLQPIADQFAAKEGLKVSVLQVPFDKIRDNLSKSGPAGEGPDIIIGAHDWLGELVQNGVIAPIDLGAAADQYSKVAIQAFTWTDGKTYGLPYAIENIALVRNTQLVPNPPKTWAELEATAMQLKQQGKVDIPLAIQQGPADPYHNYPLYSATGAYVFAQKPDGSFDAKDLGLDKPEALASADNFAKWSSEGLISKDVTYDVMIDKFGSGKAPFAITGPWATSDKDRGFKVKGVPYKVEPIPPVVEGKTPQVFVGVQGFMVSAYAKNKDLATTFLLENINKEETQLALFQAGGRPPAMTSAFDKVKSDPDVEGFGLSGQNGIPQPNIPEMASVWDTWKDAYNLIFTGSPAQKAFQDAAATIRTKIG
jgi:arabinogalactan oligomer / maltooligosaccharide transport system substrate-binding protein